MKILNNFDLILEIFCLNYIEKFNNYNLDRKVISIIFEILDVLYYFFHKIKGFFISVNKNKLSSMLSIFRHKFVLLTLILAKSQFLFKELFISKIIFLI